MTSKNINTLAQSGGTSLLNPAIIIQGKGSELGNEKVTKGRAKRKVIAQSLTLALVDIVNPFLDGNGRVGRLLITLYLVDKGILKRPILYLSDFFERNRMLYYDNLMRVRTHNDLKQWFKFFLVGIIETAKNGVETFDAILKLKKEKKKSFNETVSEATTYYIF